MVPPGQRSVSYRRPAGAASVLHHRRDGPAWMAQPGRRRWHRWSVVAAVRSHDQTAMPEIVPETMEASCLLRMLRMGLTMPERSTGLTGTVHTAGGPVSP